MNRGELEKVEQETGYNLVLIKTVTDKLRKKLKYDISYHLANIMYDNIRIGSQQRTYVFTECLNQLRGATQVEVSACCGKAMFQSPIEVEGVTEKVILCVKCNQKVLGTKRIHQAEVYRLIKEYTDELRAEENHLLEFAKGMGITADNTPQAPVITQNFVTMPLPDPHIKKVDVVGETDVPQTLIAKDIDGLTPKERRRLCLDLERKITESEIVESEEQEEDETKK